MPVIEISNDEMWKMLVLKWAHEYVWDAILEELSEDCPNYNQCTEKAFENYEPDHDEGRD